MSTVYFIENRGFVFIYHLITYMIGGFRNFDNRKDLYNIFFDKMTDFSLVEDIFKSVINNRFNLIKNLNDNKDNIIFNYGENLTNKNPHVNLEVFPYLRSLFKPLKI